MRIISWNVNGLRSVYRQNFSDWLEKSGADLVCLQEIKAREDQVPFDLRYPGGYFTFFHAAEKPGYSGVAVFSREKPQRRTDQLKLTRFDDEGRLLRLDFPDFTLINLYLPHGGRFKENLVYKLACYDRLLESLKGFAGRKVVLTGDFNIAHQEIDLARPKANVNNIMFTPEERRKIDELLALGFIDSFRHFHPEGGHYSWWPYRTFGREKNLGWRLDYVFVGSGLSEKLKDSFILAEVAGSDHCPVGVELAF